MIVNEELENRQLANMYRNLLRACKDYESNEDRKLIRKAFNFALNAHAGVRRKSGELYIFHPLSVAMIAVKEMGLGTTSIVSSLLHDVVEDTDVSLEEIEGIFGSRVAKIIDGLTKISGVIGHTRSMQAENFRKILLTMSEDVRVILVKIADRLHNMRTLDAMSKKNQLKIASETLELFAPLAHRLGLFVIKSELEDLSIKYTEPQIYQTLSTKIKAQQSRLNNYLRTFMRPIHESMKSQDFTYETKARFKSIYSIYKKMKARNIGYDQIYDLFAIRIILENSEDEKADCWRVYSIVTDFYKPNPERLRDWLSTPKVNGYESLHTTVMGPNGRWVEVQIRTQRMDDIAEKGYAAHWKYKEASEHGDTTLDDWIKQVGELLRSQDGSAIEFFDEFKMNLFTHELYVFTPRGDMKVLPSKSTALDLAFDIHTDIGLQSIGAKVNNKLVPLSYTLKNGDQVEIITSKKQKAQTEWLDFVATAKARSKIKQSLKEERKKTAENGQLLLYRKLGALEEKSRSEAIDSLIDYFNKATDFDLFFHIGNSNINVTDLNSAIKILKIGDHKLKDSSPKTESKKNPDVIEIGGSSTEEYTFANCCNPIPGDDIFGFVTIGEGIKIHRTNCPNGIKLMSNYGYRIINAVWAKKEFKEVEYFPVGIKFHGFDNLGLLSVITDVISNKFEINVKSINATTKDGAFEGSIVVNIYDTEHLDQLIDHIREIEGLDHVSRFHVDENID
jgi:guanosine-3',5'-bis(diphosphate) 3'-pyrophosphohydrolase